MLPGVIASFITTVSVFAPLAFLSGDMGQVLRVRDMLEDRDAADLATDAHTALSAVAENNFFGKHSERQNLTGISMMQLEV